MIAADTSVVVAYLMDQPGGNRLQAILMARTVVFPPTVLTEVLSGRVLDPEPLGFVLGIPILDVQDGFWQRAGILRAQLLLRGHKATLADTLIAQSCIDADIPLLTLDRDFRHFARYGGLRLAN